jgi:hypothetical protein
MDPRRIKALAVTYDVAAVLQQPRKLMDPARKKLILKKGY